MKDNNELSRIILKLISIHASYTVDFKIAESEHGYDFSSECFTPWNDSKLSVDYYANNAYNSHCMFYKLWRDGSIKPFRIRRIFVDMCEYYYINDEKLTGWFKSVNNTWIPATSPF